MTQPKITVPLLAVYQAYRRLAPYIRPTPLVRSGYLSALTGANVWLKLECRQPTGSFKVRGALNKIGLLSPEERARGLVTGSAGNHGLGVAFAGQAWGGVKTDIFVPGNAPRTKIEKLKRFAVTVHSAGSSYEEAHQAAEAFARQTGATYVQAYDDPDVIAGQGTAGLEILSDLPDADTVLVPVGGGGLIAGIAVTVKGMAPACRVIGIQPEASPSAWLSFRDGLAYDPYDNAPTIADGLAGGFGAVPFAVARPFVDQILLAGENELRRAIFELVDREQLVVEASGAIAIAPVLRNDPVAAGRNVVCVLSGSNLDTALLRDILTEFAP